MKNRQQRFGAIQIHFWTVDSIPEPTVTRDPSLTKGSPLYSLPIARFVALLAFGSLLLHCGGVGQSIDLVITTKEQKEVWWELPLSTNLAY